MLRQVPASYIQVPAPAFLPATRAYRKGELTILVGLEGGSWHLSISHPERYPTWDEIKTARYDLVPHHLTMAMLLPPPDEYVNVHLNCFHLHQLLPQELPGATGLVRA